MKVCEERSLVNAHESDVITAMDEGDLDFAEILNLLGEHMSDGGSYDRDMFAMYVADNLTPKGREALYALANWSRWKYLRDKRTEFTRPRWPLESQYDDDPVLRALTRDPDCVMFYGEPVGVAPVRPTAETYTEAIKIVTELSEGLGVLPSGIVEEVQTLHNVYKRWIEPTEHVIHIGPQNAWRDTPSAGDVAEYTVEKERSYVEEEK